MAFEMDLWVLASCALAISWIWGVQRSTELERAQAGGRGSAPGTPVDPLLPVLMLLRSLNQALPAFCCFMAASSFSDIAAACCSLSLVEGHASGNGWLGQEPLQGKRRLLIMLALAIWRAEKLESLIQRMQRSADVVKNTGLAGCLSQAVSNPGTWVWSVLWAYVRRAALVCVAGFGCTPFLRVAFLAVVMDEGCWWVVAKLQDLWNRKVFSLPMIVELVVLPLLDNIHFVPVITKVFLLGFFEFTSSPENSILLMASAFCWTAHNCHVFYASVIQDIPDSARQLWAARSGAE